MIDLSLNTRAERIHTLLMNELTPTHISVIDESAQHSGHKGVEELKKSLNQENISSEHEGQNLLETHFSLEISAARLHGLSRVKQHQLIYDIVSNEFKTGLHSLKIKIM